jgi:hypothetical protein
MGDLPRLYQNISRVEQLENTSLVVQTLLETQQHHMRAAYRAESYAAAAAAVPH